MKLFLALALALTPPIVFSPTIVQAAGKPLAIALSPATVTVIEGRGASFMLSKSGGNGRAVSVKVTAGSWSGYVTPGTAFTVPTVDDAIVNGTRTIPVTAVASTGATARATITELDNDVAPPPPPPPPAVTWSKCADEATVCYVIGTANVRYGSGSTWTAPRAVTGSIGCDNATFGDPLVGTVKQCQTDGTPGTAPPPPPSTQTCPDGSVIPATSTCPPPPPPTQQWVLAPLGTAVYARCKIAGGCHSTSAPCPYTTGLNPPAVCPVPNIIAQQGEVREYRWGGCDAAQPCRREANLWPLGHNAKTSGIASDWFLGLAGWEDEWEGVAPAP